MEREPEGAHGEEPEDEESLTAPATAPGALDRPPGLDPLSPPQEAPLPEMTLVTGDASKKVKEIYQKTIMDKMKEAARHDVVVVDDPDFSGREGVAVEGAAAAHDHVPGAGGQELQEPRAAQGPAGTGSGEMIGFWTGLTVVPWLQPTVERACCLLL